MQRVLKRLEPHGERRGRAREGGRREAVAMCGDCPLSLRRQGKEVRAAASLLASSLLAAPGP